MKFKVGDKVRSKETGEIEIVKLVPGMKEYDKIGFSSAEKGFVLGIDDWEWQEDWELVSQDDNQYLKKGTRVRILVDEGLDGDKVTCHTGVIEDEEDEDGVYGVRTDDKDYYMVKTSDVEEIKEEKWHYRVTAINGSGETITGASQHKPEENIFLKFRMPITNSPQSGAKNLMSMLQTIPARLKRLMDKNTRTLYQIGWIDEALDPTDDGQDALMEFLWDMSKDDPAFIKMAEARKKELKEEKE
jgi:hypothetical protein